MVMRFLMLRDPVGHIVVIRMHTHSATCDSSLQRFSTEHHTAPQLCPPVLVQAMPIIQKTSQMLLLFFCDYHLPKVCQCHRAHAHSESIHIWATCHAQVVFPFVGFLSPSIVPYPLKQYHTGTIYNNFLFQNFPSITKYCWCWCCYDDDDHGVRRKHLACVKSPRPWHVSVWQQAIHFPLLTLVLQILLYLFFVSPLGLVPNLNIWVITPKSKMSTAQASEPCWSPSFYDWTWENLWGCDVDDVNLPQSPPKDGGFPPKGFPDYHASSEKDSEFD